MHKVKVSKEIAYRLDKVISFYKDKEYLLNRFYLKDFSGDNKVLNELSSLEFAEILIKGYEVEETPEKKLLSIYKNSKENFPHEINYRSGIIVTLNVLNIKIKGIND